MRVGENFCPGVLHAVEAKDGLLMRIRIPGGLIETDQFRSLAELSGSFADGSIEITSRANLQIRAIQSHNLDELVRGIAAAGLLPSPLHDRVRNIVSSPMAGLDDEELIDPRPLVRELDGRLSAEPAFQHLHPKFSFAIYGGPRRFTRDSDDLSLEAVECGDTPCFHLSVGGVPFAFVIEPHGAVDCMLAAAEQCLALANEFGVAIRGKTILAVPGAADRLLAHLSAWLKRSPAASVLLRSVDETPLGVYPTTHGGCVNLVPSIPLGRLTAEQAIYIADACREGAGDLRLAPWRGVVLGAIQQGAADKIITQLRAVGVSCDGSDGFHGLAACTGINGCDAALADVRADAAMLAERLHGRPLPARWTVNLSGCDKQCARRRGASAELVATVSGYTLTVAGNRIADNCTRESALEQVAAHHESLLHEVAVQ